MIPMTAIQIQAEARRRKRQRAAEPTLPREWRPWLRGVMPETRAWPFAPRHDGLWAWYEALQPGVRPPARIEDWPRGGAKSSTVELGTSYAGMTGRRTFALYVCGTQTKADAHLQAIAGVLERAGMERAVNRYNQSKGWTQQRLRAANGFNVVSFGLDAGSRGIKLDSYRPDLIIFDDVDDRHDSLAAAQRKIETMTESIMPAGAADCAILFVQNTIHADSVMAQLIDGRAKFLLARDPIRVEPAVQGLVYEERAQADGTPQYVITGGAATWAGQDLDTCQRQINDWGLTAFLREAQHEVDQVSGSMFAHLSFQHVAPEAVPEIVAYTVWCDPAVTDTDQSDCNGLQVDGLGVDGKVYRFFSWEQRATPRQTLHMALRKAVEYGSLVVGVETDQGGDTWYSVYQQAWQDLLAEGTIPATARQPMFRSAKAGAIGSKAHRGNMMLTAYERGQILHVTGTHHVLEKALNRFLIKKPYDLADAAFWGWYDIAESGSPGL